MSRLKFWSLVGCASLACGSGASDGDGGTAGASALGPQAGLGGSGVAGSNRTGGVAGSLVVAMGGAGAANRGGASGAPEPRGGEAGEPDGSAGAPAGPNEPFVLHCTTPPLSGSVRPSAYRLSLTLAGGSAAVLLTGGDAIERPDSERSTLLETAAPVTADDDALELRLEGLSVELTRGERPAGLFGGTLALDAARHAISCWRSDYQARIRYDESSGKCQDSSGKSGLNPHALEMVRETKLGECVAFGTGNLNGNDLGYADLEGWNLAGARLSDAGLHFANLTSADLRGANLDGFSFGYAKIRGEVDAFTKAPAGSCHVQEEELSCAQ